MKRIRQFLESVVFAGMKPGDPAGPKPQSKWLSSFRGRLDAILAGGAAPNDPLYLTNRSLGRKVGSWSLIAIPCIILIAGVAYTLRRLSPPDPKPVREPSAAEITARLLPNLSKDIQLAPSVVQVLEVHVDSTHVYGAVQNTGDREVASAKLVLQLAGDGGTWIGSVQIDFDKIPPSGRKEFELPIRQRNAVAAIVKEISAR